MPPSEKPAGPTAQRVAANVQHWRDRRRVSVRALSEQLEQLGQPIPPTALSRLENGSRRVDVDDLTAIAAALNVTPLRLLMPAGADKKTEAGITPTLDTTEQLLWAWGEGTGHHTGTTDDDWATQMRPHTPPPPKPPAADADADQLLDVASTLADQLIEQSDRHGLNPTQVASFMLWFVEHHSDR